MAIHGISPAKLPNQKASHLGLPGFSYFSISSPNRIIDALTPKIAMMAAMSVMPQIRAMSTIMSDEVTEYSIQRP